MANKICSMCKKELPLSAYPRTYTDSNSLRSECKECTTIRKRKYGKQTYKNSKARCESDPDYRRLRSIQHGHLPMNESKRSPPYLGVFVAETVLSNYFDHMIRMPRNNPGYDYICGRGYRIDVKSSCLRRRRAKSDIWAFEIGKNKIADYFLCLAFDNREALTPMHIWLIPGAAVCHRVGIGIANAPKSLLKYAPYEKSLDRVVICCNEMKTMVAEK